jgi:5'-nucleotidase
MSLRHGSEWHFDTACEIARLVVKTALQFTIPDGVLLNVNVPNVPFGEVRGIRITRQDSAPYDTRVETRYDKAGVPYYWIGGKRLDTPDRDDTDFVATLENYVSITPLHADMTDYDAVNALYGWHLATE